MTASIGKNRNGFEIWLEGKGPARQILFTWTREFRGVDYRRGFGSEVTWSFALCPGYLMLRRAGRRTLRFPPQRPNVALSIRLPESPE